MAVKAQKYVVKKKFQDFLPEVADFEMVEEELPELENNQFLVQAEYLSVDPYMRSFASRKRVPYNQFGFQVGQVIDSKNENYPISSYVVSHSSWASHVILDNKPDPIFGIIPYQPLVGNLSRSLAIGALGMPGMTAYLGMLEICRPNPGDVVCVTSAAGAVGSIAGQIAKLRDCVVIGTAGSDEKVEFLLEELGFHFVFNYKTEQNLKEELVKVAPRGINCFFDNVGGTQASTIMGCMIDGGRVANCGSISTYGKKNSNRPKKLKEPVVEIEEFSFAQWDWEKRLNAVQQLKILIENNHIKAKETITEGFENLPRALIGMLNGDGMGKCLVKVPLPKRKSNAVTFKNT